MIMTKCAYIIEIINFWQMYIKKKFGAENVSVKLISSGICVIVKNI